MTDGPTSFNGPLHTDDATLSDRRITAYFATVQQAESVLDALVKADVPLEKITIGSANAEAASLQPADHSVIGKIREAVLPDDGQRAARDAQASGDVMLVVTPDDSNVDRIVDIIKASKPHHFDADLERWRNSPPG